MSFHYVDAEFMYDMEYLVYEARAFGVRIDKQWLPNRIAFSDIDVPPPPKPISIEKERKLIISNVSKIVLVEKSHAIYSNYSRNSSTNIKSVNILMKLAMGRIPIENDQTVMEVHQKTTNNSTEK